MPQEYVRKLAHKHGTSTRRAEGKWAKAKASAAASGHADNYAYITSIFQNMMHESSPEIPSLKDLTNGMSFKYFLVAEDDASMAQAKEHSKEWNHLAQFPQFNELPFKVRRELEKEVQADGLIEDFESLEPEEKESVNDALHDMVIDKMQQHLGTGVNVGDWSSTDHSNDTDEVDADSSATGGLGDAIDNLPAPRRRKERAPSHIAAMRAPHQMEPETPAVSGEMPSVGARKTYYKPWSALSDEQRAGRAKLAAKHGKLYRIKQSKWFRMLPSEQQHQVVDAVKAGHPVPKFGNQTQ